MNLIRKLVFFYKLEHLEAKRNGLNFVRLSKLGFIILNFILVITPVLYVSSLRNFISKFEPVDISLFAGFLSYLYINFFIENQFINYSKYCRLGFSKYDLFIIYI